MSAKKRHGKRLGGEALLEIAKRELSDGDVKIALKAAKQCYRESPDEQSRQILELAYAKRVEQLQEMRLSEEARAALAALIDLGPTSPQVVEQLPRLQVIVGAASVDSAAVFHQDPALLASLVDQAVRDPLRNAPDFADCPLQVVAVRDALAAVERGDDTAALARLEGIGRQSPLADWKLFVRGLIGFYQRDRQRTEQNWQRLDTARAAYRISRTLLVAVGDERPENVSFDVAPAVRSLQRCVAIPGLSESLKKLAEYWRDGSLYRFFREYGNFRLRFGTSHSELMFKIVDMIWKRAVREGDPRILDELRRIGPAPKFDPRWNRAQAMIDEARQCFDVEAIADSWNQYADDLRQADVLRDEEKPLAVGLIHLRMARDCGRAWVLDEPDRIEFDEDDEWDPTDADGDDAPQDFRKWAATYYRQAISACPELAVAYRELADLHKSADDLPESATVLEELVSHFPDEFDAHLSLAKYYLDEEEPAKAASHVQATERLKPRDVRCMDLRWTQRMATIRSLAKRKQFAAARQELTEARQHQPPSCEPFACDVIAASIEYKAKEVAAAERHLQSALAKIDDPTPVWLLMSCSSARYGLAREIKKTFDDRYKQAMAKSPGSDTLRRIAGFFSFCRVQNVNYSGRATQERLFLEKLRGIRTHTWTELELRDICGFVKMLPKQHRLRTNLVHDGVRRFPDSPFFQWWAGEQEMEKGPWGADVDEAAKHLRLALERSAADPAFTEQMKESVRRCLSTIEDFQAQEDFGAPYDDPWELESESDLDDEDDCLPDVPPELLNDPKVLADIERTLPPDLRDSVEKLARLKGVDIKEVLQVMIRMANGMNFPLPGVPIPQPTGRRTQRRR